jgi:membrane fusion protein, multidrug efflux system
MAVLETVVMAWLVKSQWRKQMRRIPMFLACGIMLFVTACGSEKPLASSTTNADSSAVAAPMAASSAATPSAPSVETRDSALVVSGPIIVEHQFDLTAQRDGIVAKIFFDDSSRVKAGALLAQLDDRQITANLDAARSKTRSIDAEIKNWQAEAEVFKADYARAQRRWDLGLISEEDLQHAKYKAESEQWEINRVTELHATAREEERSLDLELEKTRVMAPFNGLVARRYVREGQSVTKGERLFWITAEGPLLMRITLPEKLIGRIRRRQQFDITSADIQGEKHVARVREVSPVIDPASGTFEVLFELIGDHGALRPGMTADLHLNGLQ